MNADPEGLRHILEKIYRERRLDFREYKEATLIRRLARRMHPHGSRTYAEYASVLDREPAEYGKLFNDLTINVTSFFRDELAYKGLMESVLPALIVKHNKDTSTHKSLRIWSAGCATGQEPYSIAILLLKMLGPDISLWDITILATDIDANALQQAREGSFSAKDVEGIQAEWLNRYLIHKYGNFHIRPALRQLVSFEMNNLANDPPYQDLDLVVCRNVLIYFNTALQIRVLKGFYQGLKEWGFLLLGKAEVPVGETKRLFQIVDKKQKLYQKPIVA